MRYCGKELSTRDFNGIQNEAMNTEDVDQKDFRLHR